MERIELYRDIAERTNGDIYIGVVGPVRTGKSTFIKRFMDMLVLPGGMPGTMNLAACEKLTEALKKADQEKRGIAAICAAPSMLGDLGFLKGKKAVCYPGFESRLTGAEVLAVPVVTDGHITTSRGMGTAIAFALELTKRLKDEETAKQVGRSILYNV